MGKIKKIAITGGKGGTGKSTVAVLFAGELIKEGKKVVLCDCDTECPNDYLLLGQKLKEPKEKIFTKFPELNKDKCTKCGICVKACRNNAIFLPPSEKRVKNRGQATGGYPVFIKDLCSGCGACWTVCPQGAIKPEKEEVGQIYFNEITNFKIKNFYLVTGVARTMLEETGPVVRETKKFALKKTKEIGADVILFDTAAGTHCPVINALLGVDLAYVVTEPTPMGAYDLNLILDLCQKLKVPVKTFLNQADLGDKTKILKIIRQYGVKIEKEIFYSNELVQNYSKGRLLDFNLF